MENIFNWEKDIIQIDRYHVRFVNKRDDKGKKEKEDIDLVFFLDLKEDSNIFDIVKKEDWYYL